MLPNCNHFAWLVTKASTNKVLILQKQASKIRKRQTKYPVEKEWLLVSTSHYSLQWHDIIFCTCAASLYIQDNGAHFVNSCSVLCFPLNLQPAASCFIQYSHFFKVLKRIINFLIGFSLAPVTVFHKTTNINDFIFSKPHRSSIIAHFPLGREVQRLN